MNERFSPDNRLLVICNPNSTSFRRVEHEVFAPLRAHGITHDILATRHADSDHNIDDLTAALRDGDYAVSAGGDSTAMQLANAALRSKRDVTLGFLPYGNFNDTAAAHSRSNDTVLGLITSPTVALAPLSVDIDGEFWRYAVSHATIGWTAEGADEFSTKISRAVLKKSPQAVKLGYSLLQLTENYLRHGSTHLPPFHTDEQPETRRKITDIIAINSPQIAGIVRSPRNYYDSAEFGYTEVNVANLLADAAFALRAITGNTPLATKQRLDIIFDSPATVPMQLDGEFQRSTIDTVSIYKNNTNTLRVLHSVN